MRRSFSNIHCDIVDMVADAAKVAVHWRCSGIHDGVFMGVSAPGKEFSFGCMNFYYFNADGKITRDVDAEGMLGLLDALGLTNR